MDVKFYIDGLHKLLEEVYKQEKEIWNIVRLFAEVDSKDRKVYIIGNGGSASTAQHFAQGLWDLGLFASSLVDNIAILTALSNDHGYHTIFSRQLLGVVDPGDVVIGISASGLSKNILSAIRYAKQNDAYTIGLIGFDGGDLKKICDYNIIVPSTHYGQVEDVHLCLCHMLCEMIKREINM